ncbi:MAG: hypothetical protein J6R42_02315 [Clostridia bacterium]|nr:hypothetical protein [Clostridia bacterium]
MSTIKIETARCSETFDGKIRGLSDGFRHVASVQLTPKLQDKVKTEENKQSLCDTICLSAVRFSAYETYKNGISSLPFRVVSLRYATWIAECCVIWKSKDKSKLYAPWDDLNEEDIAIGLLMDQKNTMTLNRFMARHSTKKKKGYAPLPFPCYTYGKKKSQSLEVRLEMPAPISAMVLLSVIEEIEAYQSTHTPLSFLVSPRQRMTREISFAIKLDGESFDLPEDFLLWLGQMREPPLAVRILPLEKRNR